jgi:creatinine amidohydrolase
VGTDLLTASDAAKGAIRTLSKKKPPVSCILFPSIPLGFTKIAACFPGTVSTKAKVIKTIIYDVCCSLAKYGFTYFIICTFHMDLGHLKGIYAGKHKAMKSYNITISEPWGPYFYNKEVEKREPKVGFDTKKEIHAGFRETSLMNYQYPYLVDESYKTLQSIHRDLYSPRFIGKTFKDIGIENGYVGSPARADSNYGRWYFQEVVNTYVEAAIDLLKGKDIPELPAYAKRLMKSMFWI